MTKSQKLSFSSKAPDVAQLKGLKTVRNDSDCNY